MHGVVVALQLQYFGAGAGLEFDRVCHHAQHAVVADRAGEFDHSLVAEARLQRLRVAMRAGEHV